MADSIHILLTGGGSGGHVYPLIAVAEELKKKAQSLGRSIEIVYMGPESSYDGLLAENGIRSERIAGPKLRRYFSVDNFLDGPKLLLALLQAWWKLFVLMPDVIFSKGGPGALPVVLMGWFYHIPILVHESDAYPGLTNLASSIFAKRVGVSFEETQYRFAASKVFLSGNPIRPSLRSTQLESGTAKKELGFEPSRPLIFVSGGSQGSQRINEFITTNLPAILEVGQVLHQCGQANYVDMQALTRAAIMDTRPDINRYKLVPYLEKEMSMALAAADVIVARAGSGSIFEAAAFGKPLILIPLHGSANDHQRANALALGRSGAAVVIEEANLLPGIFLGQLKAILQSPETAQAMSQKVLQFAKPEAASQIADEVLSMMVS